MPKYSQDIAVNTRTSSTLAVNIIFAQLSGNI